MKTTHIDESDARRPDGEATEPWRAKLERMLRPIRRACAFRGAEAPFSALEGAGGHPPADIVERILPDVAAAPIAAGPDQLFTFRVRDAFGQLLTGE